MLGRLLAQNLFGAAEAVLRHKHPMVYELRYAHAAVPESERLYDCSNAVLCQQLRRQLCFHLIRICGQRNRFVIHRKYRAKQVQGLAQRKC